MVGVLAEQFSFRCIRALGVTPIQAVLLSLANGRPEASTGSRTQRASWNDDRQLRAIPGLLVASGYGIRILLLPLQCPVGPKPRHGRSHTANRVPPQYFQKLLSILDQQFLLL